MGTIRNIGSLFKREGKIIGILCPIVVLTGLSLFIYYPLLFSGSMVQSFDNEAQFYHWRTFLQKETIKNISLPLWNPYVFCGSPFLANIQAYIFYPLGILSLLFSPPMGFTLGAVLHILLGGLSTFLLCRSHGIGIPGGIIGAVIFSFHPGVKDPVSQGDITRIQATTWLPLILWSFKKAMDSGNIRYALLTGVAMTCQILAGNPEQAIISQACLLGYVLLSSYPSLWKRVAFLAFAFSTGYSLAGIQFIPSLEFTGLSIRSEGVSLKTATLLSLDLNTLWIFYIMPSSLHQGIHAIPFGMGNLIFVIFILAGFFTIWPKPSWTYFILWFFLGFSLFIAAGRNTPLFSLLHYIPGFHFFKNPRSWENITLLCLAVITGGGVDKIFTYCSHAKSGTKNLPVFRAALGMALFFSTIGFFSAVVAYLTGGNTVARGFLSWCIEAGGFAGLLRWTRSHTKAKALPQWILLFLVSLDLVLFSRYFVLPSKTPNNIAAARRVLERILPPAGKPYRVMALKQALTHLNDAVSLELHTPNGYDPLILRDYAEFITRAMSPTDIPLDDLHLIQLDTYDHKLVDLLNIRFILSPERLEGRNLVLRHKNVVYLYENTAALPRAFLVDRVVLKKKERIIAYMSSPQFNPRKEVVVEEGTWQELSHLAHGRSSSSRVNIVRYRPNEVTLEVESGGDGVLVLSDIYYPGWHVEVDGQEKRIIKINFCFRGVPISQGLHRVHFAFRPRSLRIGLWFSILGLLLALGGLIIGRYR